MKNISLKFFLAIAFLIIAASCTTRLPTPQGIPEVSLDNYAQAVYDKTKKIEIYDGLYNKLTVQATWLDSLVSEYTLSHNARLLQWQEPKYREERTKKVSKNAENSEFFVSFFTPERKYADLSSSRNLWKIYLDVNGQRYEGKASKVKQSLTEIQALYPYHNRWSVPYVVTFPIATSLVENKNATLVFTGTVGSAELRYTPVAK